MAKPTLDPFTDQELLEKYREESGSINKHLLEIYSMVIGLKAKRVVDLGAGATTRVIRKALQTTGGEQFTCDYDKTKWEALARENKDPKFHFEVTDSESFIKGLKGPFDFVLHDAAHDLWQVKWDLEHLYPMMKQFGIICIHDTQNSVFGDEILKAIRGAFSRRKVSWTHLPYNYGLTIVRVEDNPGGVVLEPYWNKEGSGFFTSLRSYGTINKQAIGLSKHFVRDIARYLQWKFIRRKKNRVGR